MSSPLDGLPPQLVALVPGLSSIPLRDEVLASCSRCAMAPQPHRQQANHRIAFEAPARCCTYQPDLPNFLVGRALRRGGPGAERLRARMNDPEGLHPQGIRAPAEYRARYDARHRDKTAAGFGHDADLTCPYWVGGERGCSIHADRDAVCRTWFCKVVDGRLGANLYKAMRKVLERAEDALGFACLGAGVAPKEGAPPSEWEAWYLRCADYVDALDDAAVDRLRDAELESAGQDLARFAAQRDRPLPEIVGVNVQQWFKEGDGWAMTAWSAFDLVEVPSWIFALLGRLDGNTPWRVAKEAAEAELGRVISDDLILTLWRRGLLCDPQGVDAKPGMTVDVTGPELRSASRWYPRAKRAAP
jgi:hypothetical protein